MIPSKYNKHWNFLSKNGSIAFIFLVRWKGGKTVLKEVIKLDVTQQHDRLGRVNLTLPS